eukprot:Anaeramoba_ignava/a610467_13.p1 GENE.a610467_13~~a610467_13.p1  ORF type:complete len:234 (-),score=77.15 a610467_13:154-855(-)
MFAKSKATLSEGRHKIVILDEADSMTEPAQQALRRTMELYSETTRFALACNFSNKIIEPIQSRCAIMRFGKLNDSEIITRLNYLIEQEKISVTEEGLKALIFTADGDMRQAINNLQSTFVGFRFVDQNNVFKVCDIPHPGVVESITKECSNGNIKEAQKLLVSLWNEGYSATDIINTMFRVSRKLEIDEQILLEFLRIISNTHLRIVNGNGTLIQLSGMIANMCKVGLTKKMD